MNEEEKEKPKIFDDDIETLDDEEPENSASSGGSDIDTGGDYEENQSSSYNPQNRYRQNQEYHSRQYYKDRVNETGEQRKQAGREANEAHHKREQAKEDYNKSKQNYKDKKSDKDLKDQAKADKQAAKDKYKEAKQADRQAKAANREAKWNNRAAKFDQVSDTANRIAHPIETGKSYLKNKINERNPINKLKNKARQGIDAAKDKAKDTAKEGAKKVGKAAKEGAKKAGHAAKEGAKKAGQAAAKGAAKAGQVAVQGIAKLIAAIPPPVWAGIAIVLALLLIAMVIVVIFSDDDDEELVNISTTTCAYENLGGIGQDTMVKVYDCDGTTEETTIALEQYIAGVAINDIGNSYDSIATMAYLIVVRSKVLSYASNETNNYSYDSTSDVIKVNQCPETPFYWNYTNNLYRSDVDDTQYSYDENDGYPLYKSALDDHEKALYERSNNEVSCMYLTDANNKVISADIDFNTLLSQATANAGTDNGTFTGILMGNEGIANIATGQVHYNSYFSSDVGEYAKWKQCDDRWGSISLGYKNVCSWGCLLVSMSMLVAHSGVTPGTITNYNPGTFIAAMKGVGAVNASGNTSYGMVGKAIPDFQYSYKKEVGNDYKKLEKMANDGCYIALEVKTHCSGQHWVAIDNAASAAVNWSQVYIWDPGSSKDPTLDHTYITKNKKTCHYNANTAVCFKANN